MSFRRHTLFANVSNECASHYLFRYTVGFNIFWSSIKVRLFPVASTCLEENDKLQMRWYTCIGRYLENQQPQMIVSF